MIAPRLSRVALVVIKLQIAGTPYFLMRKDPSWRDITFVGGHVNDRDGGALQRAAYRELLEEVPPLRLHRTYDLVPITPQLEHGPLESPSARARVLYELQYFLIRFTASPEPVIKSLGARTLNVLVSQCDLLKPSRYKVASLVSVLEAAHPGGLEAIPLSWPANIESLDRQFLVQADLAFK